jgi:hypothetical protein
MSSAQTCASFVYSSGGSNWGCVFAIPIRPGETGTLKIYSLVQDHTSTFTAWMASNTGGIQTDSVAGAQANPGTPVTLSLAYTGSSHGDTLFVKFTGSATGGFNPRLYIHSASMF